MKKNLKAVVIHWIDSYHNVGWKHHSELAHIDDESTAVCVSVGLLIADGKKFVRIALSDDNPYGDFNDGHNGQFLTIPKAAIKSMKRIKL